MKRTPSTWLDRLNPAKSKVAAITTAVGIAATLSGCLERPLGTAAPRTTNIIVDLLAQNVVDKVDMLFVIDNSMSMADKQAILAEAVPDLVSRFVKPVCLNAEGQEAPTGANGDCPANFSPEFTPINDIHIGVITSSLGGFGSQSDCVPDGVHPYYVQKYDMAHLIGSLAEGADVPGPSAVRRNAMVNAGGDFLTWSGGGDAELQTLATNFANQVRGAGEQGCGWEATMEAWVHFLVDPQPFTSIVRQPCNGSDTSNSCAGPARGADMAPLVDNVILQQREAFLRMDSLLAVIMLTDENDCSFKLSGQQWLVSDTGASETGTFRGSAQCASNPDDPCCQSCGKSVNAGCPAIDVDGKSRAQGCESLTYPLANPGFAADSDDQGNLRCFKQKQRFGADFLLPVERYSNALNQSQICPTSETLVGCDNPVPNPVFSRGGETRAKTLVFFGGILGVPWQTLAVNPADTVLRYKKAKSDIPDEVLDWDTLLGLTPASGVRPLYPTLDGTIDPHMFESIQPRAGIPGPESPFMADPANGHDWNIIDQSDLQYACIFPKPAVDCPTEQEVREDDTADPTTPIPNCDCTYYGPGLGDGGDYNSPLCQGQGGYSMTQAFGKAYPGVRELQALEKFAQDNPTQNAIVASICPKEVSDKSKKDYGYRPAVATIVERLKEQLQEPCLPRPLATKEDGGAACVIIEATTDEQGCQIGEQFARSEVSPSIKPLVYQALETKELCEGNECQQYKLCEIPQIRRADPGYNSCISGGSGADGWCYLDRDALSEAERMDPAIVSALAKCPDTAKRKLRFAGDGAAKTASSLTFFACSGSVYDAEM